jgi:hypothetical protein
VLLVATTLALAGCGGGEKTYSADATRACLTTSDVTLKPDAWDDISTSAGGGTYGVEIGDNGVMLGFFDSTNGAKRALSAYVFGSALDDPKSDLFFRRGNVTLAWDNPPTSQQRGVVESCLK